MTHRLDLDLTAIPFSRFGSYMAISQLDAGERSEQDVAARTRVPDGIWLRCVHGASAYELMRLELLDAGQPVPFQTTSTASTLTLRSAAGQVDITMPADDVVRFRARGTTLRLTAATFRNHCAIPEPDGCWVFNMADSYRFYRLVPLVGSLSVDAPWEVKRCTRMVAELSPTEGGVAEMAIEEITWMRPRQDHAGSFDDHARAVDAEFDAFCQPLLDCPERLRQSAITGAFLDWSSIVGPHRLITRPAMYMSKNWMTNVWAWDHAFNALAVCLTDPDLAWDQFMIMFDHQADNGQLPDYINDVNFLTTFVKPPIHGWILTRMIDFAGDLPTDRLEQAYTKLSKWTDWWFTYRQPDGDGLPVYWHGNDSGWDNGTVFDVPLPLKAADLAAFLIVQMDALAGFADQLGRTDEAAQWRERADTTLAALIDKLWDGEKFRCISTVTRQPANPSDSVFSCLPILLGNRLPEPIRDALVADIQRHATEWGPATEHPESPVYEPDGYWRGPIWAPSTMILIDGLRAAGETDLARDLAQRFCRLCDQSGFAENFDAVTGAPLRDRGYTWTSSVFLVLANKYL